MAERRLTRLSPEAAFLVLASGLCTAVLTVLTLPGYWSNPTIMAPAVFVDLAIGLPALGYILLVRLGGRSPSILVPLCLLGLLLARWWIPGEHIAFPVSIELLAALLEGAVLLFVLFRARHGLSVFRAARNEVPYAIDALRTALFDVLGKRAGAAVFGEVGVLWYAFAGWRRRRKDHPLGRVFSGYRRSGYSAILAAVLLAITVETAVVHLLVSLWMVPVAWVLTALGIYSILWLLGDYHAARLNPSVLTTQHLHVRTGLRWQADLALGEILAVHEHPPPGDDVKLTMWGKPDLWIESREPVVVRGPFGIERRVRFLGLGVDDPAALRVAIDSSMPQGG